MSLPPAARRLAGPQTAPAQALIPALLALAAGLAAGLVACPPARAADAVAVPPPPQLVSPQAQAARSGRVVVTLPAAEPAAARARYGLPEHTAAVPSSPSSPTVKADGSAAEASPNRAGVQRAVVEDGGARIEETRVRGTVRSIHVQPKGAGAGLAYEVIPAVGPGGPREATPGPAGTHTAAGQRVWSVLNF
jgi:hypothetical protein